MRLFIGSFLEPVNLGKIPFKEIQDLFKDNLKPIKRNYIHLTWSFIGEIEKKQLNKLEAIINKNIKAFSDINFTSDKLELWPSKRVPRLIVLTGDLNCRGEVTSPLQKWGNDLKQICDPDIKKEFIPHVTIARFKKDITIHKNIELPIVEKFEWKIREISLIQSVLGDKGPTYTKVKNWKVT